MASADRKHAPADLKRGVPVDELDLELIAALQRDGRQSNTALGKQLGTSNVTIRNRLRRLVREGLIRVGPIVNLERWGYSVSVLLLISAQPAEIERLAGILSREPAVRSIRIISGLFDIAVDASFRDAQELTQFLRALHSAPGVVRIQSNHVIETSKRDAEWTPPSDRRLGAGNDHRAPAREQDQDRGASVLLAQPAEDTAGDVPQADLRVAAAWLRALLRGDIAGLFAVSAEAIALTVASPVALTGTYIGKQALVEHARSVVRQFPLIDSRILSVRPDSGQSVDFVTEVTGITSDGRYVHARHLIRATVRNGEVVSVTVEKYAGPVPDDGLNGVAW